jgi:hypothetical protein
MGLAVTHFASSISTTISISTVASNAKDDIPTADRACRPQQCEFHLGQARLGILAILERRSAIARLMGVAPAAGRRW